MSTGSGRLEHLLQPSLGGSGNGAITLYSVRACFFVAFLGGVAAIAFFAALNSRRLGRLAKDAWLYVLALLALVVLVVSFIEMKESGIYPAWIDYLGEGMRGARMLNRLLAIGVFGVVYWMHRPYLMASALTDDPDPNPWVPGIVCTVLGTLVVMGIGTAWVTLR